MLVSFLITFPLDSHRRLSALLYSDGSETGHMKPLSINSINELLVRVVCIGAIDIWYTNWTGRSDKDLPGREESQRLLPPEKLIPPL